MAGAGDERTVPRDDRVDAAARGHDDDTDRYVDADDYDHAWDNEHDRSDDDCALIAL